MEALTFWKKWTTREKINMQGKPKWLLTVHKNMNNVSWGLEPTHMIKIYDNTIKNAEKKVY